MTGKEFYDMFKENQVKANRLAREVVKQAQTEKVSIPMLVKSLCEMYAANEADIAGGYAYDGGFDRGYSEGVRDRSAYRRA